MKVKESIKEQDKEFHQWQRSINKKYQQSLQRLENRKREM